MEYVAIDRAEVIPERCEDMYETHALMSFHPERKEVSLTFKVEKDAKAWDNLTVSFNVLHVFDLLEKIEGEKEDE